MPIFWRPQFRIGQDDIDADHRYLILLINTVELVLRLEIAAATSLPAAVFTGVTLDVSVDDKAGPAIREAGKDGTIDVAADTRIERRVTVPVARFVPTPSETGFATVAVQWQGLPGANCVFKVAPDGSKVDIAKLDLAKTKVVLVTNHGDMTLSFRPDKAPHHVESFLKLCKQGFYDGTKFHRVIKGFMIQGGDPLTKDDRMQERWGTGDPGYKLDAEFNDIRHTRGVLSMARGPDPNSAGSQFFIVHGDATQLDGQYTAFGNLEAGADTLDSIANTPCGGRAGSAPLTPVVLEAAVILPVMK